MSKSKELFIFQIASFNADNVSFVIARNVTEAKLLLEEYSEGAVDRASMKSLGKSKIKESVLYYNDGDTIISEVTSGGELPKELYE